MEARRDLDKLLHSSSLNEVVSQKLFWHAVLAVREHGWILLHVNVWKTL